ncbi:MAG: hypothetical protein JXL84_14980 [Deltaproteobacteria bacterium]|nr:hypothetical protein [Deltaproteobacteria bacterium]
MSKSRSKIDSLQLSIFDFLRSVTQGQEPHCGDEGSLNIRERLRLAMVEAIKGCRPLSRWEIAGRMSHLLGVEISKYMLDAWTAESKGFHRMPAEYLPAFCVVTGSRKPLEVLASTAGMFALPGPEALRAEIQRFAEEERRARREKRKRVGFLEYLESEGKGR